MEYRLLGASGLEVSVLSFGTMTLGGEGRFAAMGNVQVEEARRLIEICIEAGVNLFDTAEVYSSGKSEEVLGKALGARRRDMVLATKVFAALEPGTNKAGLTRRHILEACEASLRRLGTDYIDLYQAHNFDSMTPLDETLRTFEDLIRAGKIRYAGCSNYSGWQLMKAHSIAFRTGSGFSAIFRSRSTIRFWRATRSTNWCPPAWTSAPASWPGVRCNSASCRASSAAARRSPRNRG